MRLTGPMTVLAVTLVLLLPASVSAIVSGDDGTATPARLLVGFDSEPSFRAIRAAGGTVTRALPMIGVAEVYTADAASFRNAMAGVSGVSFIETNDRLVHDGSQWDGSQWDGSQWDGSQWDAAQWDGSQWDASQWDGSQWDAAQWDGSQWDGSQWDGSQWDGSQWDASWWDAAAWGQVDPAVRAQWGLRAVHAGDAWDITRGDPALTVCVLDSGIDAAHPDLAGALRFDGAGLVGYNAMTHKAGAIDEDGHGTHVAGIIAATSGNGHGVSGLARVTLLPVKVLNATAGSEADLAEGLLYCHAKGARIGSMSLHVTERSETLARAVLAAQRGGMLLVAATGNEGRAEIPFPAAYPGVLAVGAALPNGTRAAFSNYGEGVGLLAPGRYIASTFVGSRYAVGSGTSQAAPFASAAAALAMSAAPQLSAPAIREALLASARDTGPAGPDRESGRGLLDAYGAVLLAKGRSG